MPSKVFSTTGKNAASDRNATLAASPSPNQTESSGIHANSEICFSVWKLGPSSFSASRDAPSSAPNNRPALAPIAKPARSRHRLAPSATNSLPLVTWSTAVCQTFSGGTSSGELDQPKRTAAHHRSTSAIGSTQPRSAFGTMWPRSR